MKLTLTNNANYAVPIMSPDGEGFADVLEPSTAYELDNEAQVVIVGNKPSVTEQITEAFERLAKTVRALITAWQQNNNREAQAPDAAVKLTMVNHGEKAVRTILGDGVTEVTVAPGARWEGDAWGYIELRELGNVAVDPNQHEAA